MSAAFGFAPGPEDDAAQAYQFGAVVLDAARTRFRLWAPGVAKVQYLPVGGVASPMHAVGDGFYELICNAPPGTRYYFGLPDGSKVPDPASRMQDDDVHDPSVVIDVANYAWRTAHWKGRPWTEAVVYEAHAGLLGGFKGVEQRLPRLAHMGVTAIELMPIADFPGPRNWGYDGVLPFAPDSAYGTPSDLKRLIDTAHELGLMVLLDVVYNHFGPDGNYLPQYAPEFFRNDIHTPWGPAIDFRQAQVRRFFAENALYWLREYRFDGLRLDAVHAISDRSWLTEMAAFVRGALDPSRHVHLVLENDDNAAGLLKRDFEAQWNDDGHHVLHHILTGEQSGYYASYIKEPAKKLARVLSQGFVYQGEPDPGREGKLRGEPTVGLTPDHFVLFLQNHDQIGNRAFGERLTQLNVPTSLLRTACALQLLTPQIPLLFMGEEQGAQTPFLYFTSHEPELATAVREGRRNEFAGFPAFSRKGSTDAIPDPNDMGTWARSKWDPDDDSEYAQAWRNWYRHLLELRRRYITPRLAGARSLGADVLGPKAVRAAWLMNDTCRLVLYCNLSDQACDCSELSQAHEDELFFIGPGADESDPQSDRRSGILTGHCVVAVLNSRAESIHGPV